MEIELYKDSEDWLMYTNAGNKTITKRLNTLIKKINKNKDCNYLKNLNSFEVFIRSYGKMTTEASDTSVREMIWMSLIHLSKQCNITESTLNEIWDNNY